MIHLCHGGAIKNISSFWAMRGNQSTPGLWSLLLLKVTEHLCDCCCCSNCSQVFSPFFGACSPLFFSVPSSFFFLFFFLLILYGVYIRVCQVIPQFYSGLNSWLCVTVVTVKPLMAFVYWAVITRFWIGVNVGGIDMEMNTSWQDFLQLYKPLCHLWRTGTLQRSQVFRPIALYC